MAAPPRLARRLRRPRRPCCACVAPARSACAAAAQDHGGRRREILMYKSVIPTGGEARRPRCRRHGAARWRRQTGPAFAERVVHLLRRTPRHAASRRLAPPLAPHRCRAARAMNCYGRRAGGCNALTTLRPPQRWSRRSRLSPSPRRLVSSSPPPRTRSCTARSPTTACTCWCRSAPGAP